MFLGQGRLNFISFCLSEFRHLSKFACSEQENVFSHVFTLIPNLFFRGVCLRLKLLATAFPATVRSLLLEPQVLIDRIEEPVSIMDQSIDLP